MRKTYLCKRTCQGMVEDVRPLALRRDAEQFSSKLHSLFFFFCFIFWETSRIIVAVVAFL